MLYCKFGLNLSRFNLLGEEVCSFESNAIRLFSAARTQRQVQSGMKSPFEASQKNLKLYWRFTADSIVATEVNAQCVKNVALFGSEVDGCLGNEYGAYQRSSRNIRSFSYFMQLLKQSDQMSLMLRQLHICILSAVRCTRVYSIFMRQLLSWVIKGACIMVVYNSACLSPHTMGRAAVVGGS